MKKGKIALSILCLVVGFLSCNKDDGGDNITEVELRDRTEQQAKDKDSIVKYLNGHYYNASAFVNNPDPSIKDLIISELPSDGLVPDPDNNKLLMDAVELKTVTFSETNYEYYILNLNPNAAGEAPKFSDQIRVSYEGFTLDNKVFDNRVTPENLDLVSLVSGWRKVMPLFNSAEMFVIQNDGVVDYMNHGVGIMFLPSGLGYFSNPPPGSGIPSYAPIVFKFDLLQIFQNDHDNDGVPSYLEDLTGDGEFTFNTDDAVADDDTDGDNIPDYVDIDDDGDGISTKNEIVINKYNRSTKEEVETLVLEPNEELIRIFKEDDGTYTGTTIVLTDSDNDGIPDYLDAE